MNKIRLFYNKLKNDFSIKKQIRLVFDFSIFIILIVNINLFYYLDKELLNIDGAYLSNEYNLILSDNLVNVQKNMEEYILTKDTEALNNYYIFSNEVKECCESMNYSSTVSDIYIMQVDIVALLNEYLKISDEAISNKRGRNVIKYKKSYENATNMYNYVKDYIYSVNQSQFQQNTEAYNLLCEEIKKLEIISIIVLMIIILIELVLSEFFTKKIIDPLTNLTKKASIISAGNFDVDFPKTDKKNEIAILTNAFSDMILSIKKHIEREKKAIEDKRDIIERELDMKAKVKDAELKYFQSQTDPHFLFNTLNAGMQLAMLEDATRTGQYVGNVANFFRYNLKKDNGITNLEDELNLVDYYMAILKVRFGDDIRLEKNIDYNFNYIELPKMIIQPLVENAVNYGIKDMEIGGDIYLSVYKEADELLISVADDGDGMSQEDITAIFAGTYQNNKKRNSSNGVGLNNIISRLKLFFNKEDIFEIKCEAIGRGLEIIIHIPLEED